MNLRALARIAALACALAGADALAHEVPASLPMTLEARNGRLRAHLDLSPAFPPDLARQVGNGLTNVIAVHLALVSQASDEVSALYSREIDILYDVWDEAYRVTVKDVDADRPRSQTLTFQNYRSLRSYLSELRQTDLGPLSALGTGSWIVQTRVEVNPISKELLERTREFIANPASGSRVSGSSRSVLGVMASYLLRGSDSGAEVHRFRSAPFTVREVTVR